MADERVAIFIDGSNLYHALKDNCGRADLNFGEFTKKLCGQRTLFRTYYYNVLQDPSQRPDGHRDQQDFLDVLRRTPYLETRLGGTKLSQGVTVEKGIDIMLATDLVNFGWKNMYDAAVLVSGDADFAYAVKVVKDMAKHVEVAYFESNISKDLLELADVRHALDRDYFKALWTSGRGGHRPRRRRGGQPPQAADQRQQPAPASVPPVPVPVEAPAVPMVVPQAASLPEL